MSYRLSVLRTAGHFVVHREASSLVCSCTSGAGAGARERERECGSPTASVVLFSDGSIFILHTSRPGWTASLPSYSAPRPCPCSIAGADGEVLRVEGSSLAPCSEASMTTYASTPKSTTTRRPGPSQQPQARRRAPPRQEHCGRSFRRARPELAPWEHHVSTQWRIQMHSCIKTAKPSIQWMCQWMFSDY